MQVACLSREPQEDTYISQRRHMTVSRPRTTDDQIIIDAGMSKEFIEISNGYVSLDRANRTYFHG